MGRLLRFSGAVILRGVNAIVMLTLAFSSLVYIVPATATAAETLLYSQTAKENYSNFNDNGAGENYAWRFTAANSGIPARLVISVDRITGTPTGNLCIRADKTASSASFGCANGVTFAAGDNTFALANGATLTAGTNYWIYFTRTSNANNYPSIQYRYPATGAPLYRGSASGVDPDVLWFSYDIAMSIASAGDAGMAQTPMTLYSQMEQGTYSYFSYRGADERFSWQWRPTVSGTPTQITLYTEQIKGVPTGTICIRAEKKAASQSYGCTGNVTFVAGANVLSLTGGAPVTAGNVYWIYYTKTSGGDFNTNYAAFQYKYPVTGSYKSYRSSILGADPSDADYWFTYDIKMSVAGIPSTPTEVAPAPSVPTGVTHTSIIYDQPIRDTYSNFNWNPAPDNYAWQWGPVANAIPNQITLYVDRVVGVPKGTICIRASASLTSESYGCAENITLKAGANTFALTGGKLVEWEKARNGYYIHFTRTSDLNNYPSFSLRNTGGYYLYRATAANAEPNKLWTASNDVAMTIVNVQSVLPVPTIIPDPVTMYSQPIKNNYSNFNWNPAPDNYAWQWEPTQDGVPTQLFISVERVEGKPTGTFCIREGVSITSRAVGCSDSAQLSAGENFIKINDGLPVYKERVYYVHFTRTSAPGDYPSFQYNYPATHYGTYRSTAASGDATTFWHPYDIAMRIQGTPTAPLPKSNLIYGLTPYQALSLYNKLSTLSRLKDSYTVEEAAIISDPASAAVAGRSTVVFPGHTLLEAKEFPKYFYPYRYLIPEFSKGMVKTDIPMDTYVEYDQLGAALGKAPTMPTAPASADKTGYIYGMPRADADSIYKILKVAAASGPQYIDAGDTGIYSKGALWEIATHQIPSGLYRYRVGQVPDDQANYRTWTRAYAESHGYKDYSFEEAKAPFVQPYHFLAPGFSAALSTTSVTSGVSSVISFPPEYIKYAIPFTLLESTLGYPPSGAMTPNLVYVAPPPTNLAPIDYSAPAPAYTLIPAPVVVAPAQQSTPISTATMETTVPVPATVSERLSLSEPLLNSTLSQIKTASNIEEVFDLRTFNIQYDTLQYLTPEEIAASGQVCEPIPTMSEVLEKGRDFNNFSVPASIPKEIAFVPQTFNGIFAGIVGVTMEALRGACQFTFYPVESIIASKDFVVEIGKAASDVNEYVNAIAKGKTPPAVSSNLSKEIIESFNEFAKNAAGDDFYAKGFSIAEYGVKGASILTSVESLEPMLGRAQMYLFSSRPEFFEWLASRIAKMNGDVALITEELAMHGLPGDLALTQADRIAAVGTDVVKVKSALRVVLADEVKRISSLRASVISKLAEDQAKLQSVFDQHGADFGIIERWNPTIVKDKFVGALQNHINSSDVQVIAGTYRNQSAIHFYNPKTYVNLVTYPDGNLWTGWKLGIEQARNLSLRGNLQ